MGDFKIGTTRPPVGNIKLGGRNVYEIYSGATKVWPFCSDITPAEITLGGQIWQNKNSVVTAKIGGGNISIVTSSSAWNSAYSSNTPAAAYWGFNSANANYGLFYNIHCLNTIQPPTGFRVPDGTDLVTLSHPYYPNGTSLSNNDCGLWPPSINTNSDLNTAGWNGQGRGYLGIDSNGDVIWNPTVGSGSGASANSVFWNATQPAGQGMYAFRLRYDGSTTPPYIDKSLPTYFPGHDPNAKDFGFNIRFVKDVANSGIYGNFTGSPDDTQSGTPNVYTQTSQTFFNSSNNQQNRVATSIITIPTANEFRFKAKVNSGNFTMNSVQIFAYADSARTIFRGSTALWNGPQAMTSSYQDPWGPLTLSNAGTYFLKVSFNLSTTGSGNQQGYQLTLT